MPLPLFLGVGAAVAAAAGVVKSQLEKSKEVNTIISEAEAQCAKEAKTYTIQNQETELQEKMRKMLLKNAFARAEKNEGIPFSDWKHLSTDTHIVATRKYSMLTWNEYAFFTDQAIYYHNKRQGVHEFLFYDGINTFDASTGTVDYGCNHQKRNIAHWEPFEKAFVKQISRIWNIVDETDTSTFSFCFNECQEFKRSLCYYQTNTIENTFEKECQRLDSPKVLRDNFHHIQMISVVDSKVQLQFWEYFPKVESVSYSEDDSEDDIWEKNQEQERREREAEEREIKAQYTHTQLIEIKNDIEKLFQQALYKLFGVMFAEENITFIDEPRFDYEEPSALDRLSDAANSAQAFINDYADKHNSKR